MNDEFENFPPMLSTKQVYWSLNIARASLNRYVADGRIRQPVKMGGSNRWTKDYIRHLMEVGIPETVSSGDDVT